MMQQQQLVLLTLLLILFVIKVIPEIIDMYRNHKITSIKPYAFFRIRTSGHRIINDKLNCEVDFTRCCNKMGMLLFIREFDKALGEDNIDLLELVQDVRKAEERGGIGNVESADEDS
jgi:hypothetical protein